MHIKCVYIYGNDEQYTESTENKSPRSISKLPRSYNTLSYNRLPRLFHNELDHCILFGKIKKNKEKQPEDVFFSLFLIFSHFRRLSR